MREILFRGKRTDNGEWVYGAFSSCDFDGESGIICKPSIIDYDDNCLWVEVIPETVGQYTGLTDETGNKIFEGDIVITKATSCEFVGCIAYSTEYVRFVCVTKSKIPYPMDSVFDYEIIGNVYDNPDLLKGE